MIAHLLSPNIPCRAIRCVLALFAAVVVLAGLAIIGFLGLFWEAL